MENCAGKELLDAKVKLLSDEDEKVNKLTLDKAVELVDYLEKALCCITYPVKEKYFSWKSLCWKETVTQGKCTLKLFNSDPHHKTVVIVTKMNEYYEPASKIYKFAIYARLQINNEYILFQRYDGEDYNFEGILNLIVKEIAYYTVKFARENNVH